MSRDTAAAILSEPSPAQESFNGLLERQMAEARGRGGELDLSSLLKTDQRALRSHRFGAARHRALDAADVGRGAGAHPRDPRGERIAPAGNPRQHQGRHHHGRRRRPHRDLQSHRRANFRLLPGRDPRPRPRFPAARDRRAGGALEFLERCAAKIDDTHVDLAAHQTWGVTKEGGPRRGGSRGQQGKPQPARRLHRLHSRHHRAPPRRAIDARERGALPHPGRARTGGDRGVRRRSAADSST